MADTLSYPQTSRGKLEDEIETLQFQLDVERANRIQVSKQLKSQIKSGSDIHWELRETKISLNTLQASYNDLKKNWEEAKGVYESGIEESKKLKREKKELKQRLQLTQEDVSRLEKEISLAKENSLKLLEQINTLRVESARDEEAEDSLKSQEIARAYDKIKDLEKRHLETLRSFEIERGRFSTRQKAEDSNVKRALAEREYTQQSLDVAQKKLDEKQRQLIEAFDEIDQLEKELKEYEDEAEKLQSRIVELENDKKSLKKEIENIKNETSNRVKKEVAEYVNRINDLRRQNTKLNESLNELTAEKDQIQSNLQSQQLSKLEEFKIDMDNLREENRRLNQQVKDLRREDIRSIPKHEVEHRKLILEVETLQETIFKLKERHAQDFKGWQNDIEDEQAKSNRLHRQVEHFRGELNQAKIDSQNEYSDLKRKITILEEKNKRLNSDTEIYKKDLERLVVAEQQLKNQMETESRRSLEKIANLERQRDESESKAERLEEKFRESNFDLKTLKEEMEYLNNQASDYKKSNEKLSEREKLQAYEITTLNQIREELQAQLQSMTTKYDAILTKSKQNDKDIDKFITEIKRAREKENTLKNSETKLKSEISELSRKNAVLEAELGTSQRALQESQNKSSADANNLKQQLADQNSKALKLDADKERKHKEEIETVKAKHVAHLKDIEISFNREKQSLKNNQEELIFAINNMKQQLQISEATGRRKDDEIESLRKKLSKDFQELQSLEESHKLYEKSKDEIKELKDKIYNLTHEKEQDNAEKNRLQKQISNLEEQMRQEAKQKDDILRAMNELKEKERSTRAEMSARESKIKLLIEEQSNVKKEMQRLSESNFELEKEKAKLQLQTEQLKGDDHKAVLNVTIDRLREELTEKEEKLNNTIKLYSNKNRDLESKVESLNYELSTKVSEVTNLKSQLFILKKLTGTPDEPSNQGTQSVTKTNQPPKEKVEKKEKSEEIEDKIEGKVDKNEEKVVKNEEKVDKNEEKVVKNEESEQKVVIESEQEKSDEKEKNEQKVNEKELDNEVQNGEVQKELESEIQNESEKVDETKEESAEGEDKNES